MIDLMAWKNLKQRSLADSMLIDHDALRELDDVHALINWLPLEQLLSSIHSKSRGEKAWPPIMMFKTLLLQSWYRLSYPRLEKQLARDLLFRRFVALDISESVSDHSSFWRFRQKLEQLSLMDNLLDEVNEQLVDQGLLIKSGGVSIVDASVSEVNQCRSNKDKDGNSTQDPGAGWNVKAGSDGKRKSTYGYKAHINVDEDGFIKATDYTAGNVHDSNYFTDMLNGDESSLYADSAYLSRAHNDWLSESEIENRIIKRAYRNRPLDKSDRQFNRSRSGVRCTVERVFGVLKQHYAMAKARYLGRNRIRFELMCVAHNMKRGLSIHSLCA
jgi:IS5 family transposase